MTKRNKSARFARVKGRGIDRTELKLFPGVWSRTYHGTSVLGEDMLNKWFVLPRSLNRLTLCVSKRRMKESYRVTLDVSVYRRGKWIGTHRGLRNILRRMGGGVLYIAVEV